MPPPKRKGPSNADKMATIFTSQLLGSQKAKILTPPAPKPTPKSVVIKPPPPKPAPDWHTKLAAPPVAPLRPKAPIRPPVGPSPKSVVYRKSTYQQQLNRRYKLAQDAQVVAERRRQLVETETARDRRRITATYRPPPPQPGLLHTIGHALSLGGPVDRAVVHGLSGLLPGHGVDRSIENFARSLAPPATRAYHYLGDPSNLENLIIHHPGQVAHGVRAGIQAVTGADVARFAHPVRAIQSDARTSSQWDSWKRAHPNGTPTEFIRTHPHSLSIGEVPWGPVGEVGANLVSRLGRGVDEVGHAALAARTAGLTKTETLNSLRQAAGRMFDTEVTPRALREVGANKLLKSSPARIRAHAEIDRLMADRSPAERKALKDATDVLAHQATDGMPATKAGRTLTEMYKNWEEGAKLQRQQRFLPQVEPARPIAGLDIRFGQEREAANLRQYLDPRFEGKPAADNEVMMSQHPDLAGHQVVGEITPEEWAARTLHVLGGDTPAGRELGLKLAYWYRELGPLFEHFFGEDAPAILRGFGVSQANASPSGGLLAVLRVRDKLLRGEKIGSREISSVVDSIKAAVNGDPVEKGVAAKLSDFIDSLRGAETRSWVGHDIRGGAPTAIDIHAQRDLGQIDPKILATLRDRHGIPVAHLQLQKYENEIRRLQNSTKPDKDVNDVIAARDKFLAANGDAVEADRQSGLFMDNPQSSATGSTYNAALRKYQEITDHLNQTGFLGKNDWTPAETQALGWSAIQRFHGVVPEDAMYAIERNTSTLALEVLSGRSEFGKDLPIWAKQAVTKEVVDRILPRLVKEENGFLRSIHYGLGGDKGVINPGAQVKMVATPEQVDRMVSRLASMFDQHEVWGVRTGVNVSARKGAGLGRFALEINSPVFERDPARAGLFFDRLREIVPTKYQKHFQGFSSYARDGQQGIRVITATGPKAEEAAAKWRAEVQPYIEQAARETHVPDVRYNSTNVEVRNRAVAEGWGARGGRGALHGPAGEAGSVGDPLAAEARTALQEAIQRHSGASGQVRRAARFAAGETGGGDPRELGRTLWNAVVHGRRELPPPEAEGPVQLLGKIEQQIHVERQLLESNSPKIAEKASQNLKRLEAERTRMAAEAGTAAPPSTRDLTGASLLEGDPHIRLVDKTPGERVYHVHVGDTKVGEIHGVGDGKYVPHVDEPYHRGVSWSGEIVDRTRKEAAQRVLSHALMVSPAREEIPGMLHGAKSLRGKVRAARSIEAGKRSAAGAQAFQEAGGGVEGLHAKLRTYRGEYPTLAYRDFQHFTPEALQAMINEVEDSPKLLNFEKTRAQLALKEAHENGTLPKESEIALLQKVFPAETVKSLEQATRTKYDTALHYAGELLNLPRSIQSSYDLSALLRQGLVASGRHPVLAAKNIPGMLRAAAPFKGEGAYERIMAEIHSRPGYEKMMESGLALPKKEEFFTSGIAERIPGVNMSGRAYTAFLAKMRADMFDQMAEHVQQVAESKGRDGQKAVKQLVGYINAATGRGGLSATFKAGGKEYGLKGEKFAKELNTLFFSPRLFASRIAIFKYAMSPGVDPRVRLEATRALAQTFGALVGAVYLAKRMGANINMDPRNPDFGKIRFGNTRVDPFAGFQQPLRLMAQEITGKQISSTTGKTYSLANPAFGGADRPSIAFNFARSKFAPTPSFAFDVWKGKDVVGRKIHWGGFGPVHGGELYNRGMPLLMQDVLDVWHQTHGNMSAAMFLAMLGGLGVGVQAYGPKPPKGKGGYLPAPSGSLYGGGGGSGLYGGGGGGGLYSP